MWVLLGQKHDWQIPTIQGILKAQGRIGQDPDTITVWTINGQSPLPGQIFKNPDLARAFKLIAAQGISVLYRGEIARVLFAKSTKLSGTMTLKDVARYSGYWRQPASNTYDGYTINETTAPSQELMGGEMQVQGNLQVLVNMLDLGASLQAATDMARFYHNQVSDTLDLETDLYDLVSQQLISLGHTKTVPANGSPMGGYQAIKLDPGFYRAGSDHRKDGSAVVVLWRNLPGRPNRRPDPQVPRRYGTGLDFRLHVLDGDSRCATFLTLCEHPAFPWRHRGPF